MEAKRKMVFVAVRAIKRESCVVVYFQGKGNHCKLFNLSNVLHAFMTQRTHPVYAEAAKSPAIGRHFNASGQRSTPIAWRPCKMFSINFSLFLHFTLKLIIKFRF